MPGRSQCPTWVKPYRNVLLVQRPPSPRKQPPGRHPDSAASCQIRTNVPRRCNYLLTGSGETILDILGLEAMNAWFVVMIILLGISALTLHRYDVQHVLMW